MLHYICANRMPGDTLLSFLGQGQVSTYSVAIIVEWFPLTLEKFDWS